MTTADSRLWWSLTKDEQKRQIEEAVEGHLSQAAELSDRHKMLLRDALAHTYRGLFGLAAQDLYELGLPESAWAASARVEPAMVEGITRDLLRRTLATLRATTVQERPVF